VSDHELSNTPVDELVALALRTDRDSHQYRRDPNAFRDARDERRRTSGLAAAIEACERSSALTA
jgi:hypothetical protein